MNILMLFANKGVICIYFYIKIIVSTMDPLILASVWQYFLLVTLVPTSMNQFQMSYNPLKTYTNAFVHRYRSRCLWSISKIEICVSFLLKNRNQ